MKKQTVNEIKNSKPFNKVDVLVYVTLLLIVFALFAAFVFSPAKKDVEGFIVEQDGKTVLTYTLSDKNYVVSSEFAESVEITDGENGVYFKIYQSNGTKYNIVYIDFDGYADVTESNCSTSADCVHSPAITNSGAIVCVPNSLKVSPINGNYSDQPVVG